LLSDAEIVLRVRKGNTEEFRELVVRHQRPALTLAFRILGRWEDAEDAVQDAFVRAFGSLHTFLDDVSFRPWLRKIVINCCLKRMKRRERAVSMDTLDDSDMPFVDSPEAEVLQRCDSGKIRAAVMGLPPAYRTVVVLRYQEGLSTSETADIIGDSEGSVRVKLHRALKMIGKRLAVAKDEQ
jgi:RNA polymerase sigma-70 factor, ECF subfamily